MAGTTPSCCNDTGRHAYKAMPHVNGQSGWWATVDDGTSWRRFGGLRGVEAFLADCGVPVGETKLQHLHWLYEARVEGRAHHIRRVFGALPPGVAFHSGAYHEPSPRDVSVKGAHVKQ